MATTGHEHERVEVQGLKASMKKGGNIGIYNDCICSTAAATAAKVTNTVPPSFSLTAKAKILVKFTYGINVANATLQVGENAAKPIYYQGNALDAGRVKAGMFVLLQYDGTNFNIVGDIAKMDAYYKNLHAGLADNLFGSTQTDDVFTFRPTAGIQDVASGDAPVGGGTIKKVEGNGVSWNQLMENSNAIGSGSGEWKTWDTGVSLSIEGDSLAHTKTGGTGISAYSLSDYLIQGHKYYLCVSIKAETGTSVVIGIYGGEIVDGRGEVEGNGDWIRAAVTINESYYPSLHEVRITNASSATSTIYTKDYTLIDLTLLGIDNLTTTEEVEAWLANNVGLKEYYPYNEGELIPVKDFKVKSVGFNMIDESKVVSGMLSSLTGEIQNAGTDDGRVTDYIPVIPNAQYCLNGAFGLGSYLYGYCFYDDQKKYISGQTAGIFQKQIITVPSGARYLRANYLLSTGIEPCINLSYDDDKDGTYEEHWEREVGIDVTKLYGKLNGSGDYVQVFPDGMRGVGTAKDIVDLRNAMAMVKTGDMNLGEQTYMYDAHFAGGDYPAFHCDAPTGIKTSASAVRSNLACARYMAGCADDIFMGGDLLITSWDSESSILYICNHSYTNPAMLKDSLQDVYLYYELATPLTYTDLIYRDNGVDTPVSELVYRVDNYGTEEVLLGNDEGLVSSSPKMTISYGINAADTIADLPHSYVSVLPQQLDEDKQKQARNNIGAASQYDMIVVKKQLELIDKKVENDYYVDMGLPSGLLWAKRNIDVTQPDGFAASPFQYECSFFSWGNVDGHNPISTTEFDYDFGTSNDGVYASTPGATIHYPSSAGLSFDIARKTLGAPWRLPLTDDFKELFENCKFVQADGETEIDASQADKRVTVNSSTGIYLKSKINGNLLFFPCSGRGIGSSWGDSGSYGVYWSSQLNSEVWGWDLGFTNGGVTPQDFSNRFYGFACRPVM